MKLKANASQAVPGDTGEVPGTEGPLLLHTADIHLGRRTHGDPNGAVRLATFRRIITEHLPRTDASVLLICGDLFDSPQTDRVLVQEAARLLTLARDRAGKPVPVVIIPGNHDPAESCKLWGDFREAAKGAAHIHLALEPRLIELLDGTVQVEAYPCPEKYGADCPWAQRNELGFAKAARCGFRVVAAHGTVAGGPIPEGDTGAYPISREQISALDVDYVALGHFHADYLPADGAVRPPCVYCGTPETDQFGLKPGSVVLVRLRRDAPVAIERVVVGHREWVEMAVSGNGDLKRIEELRRRVTEDPHPERFVVRFRTSARAALSPEDAQVFEEVETALTSLGATLVKRGEVFVQVDLENLDWTTLPSGAVAEALRSLADEWRSCKDEHKRRVLAASLQLGWQALRKE